MGRRIIVEKVVGDSDGVRSHSCGELKKPRAGRKQRRAVCDKIH